FSGRRTACWRLFPTAESAAVAAFLKRSAGSERSARSAQTSPVPFSARVRFANPAPARRAAFSNLRLCRYRRASHSRRPRSSIVFRDRAPASLGQDSQTALSPTLCRKTESLRILSRDFATQTELRHNRTRNSCVVAMRRFLPPATL